MFHYHRKAVFTDGLNPLQVIPADLERFYDHVREKVNLNTAYQRIKGLKKFFSNICKTIPFYTSPFDILDKKLDRKLCKTKKGNRTKKALSKQELQDLLRYLKQDTGIKGLQNYAIVLFLVTSGLRSHELCQLRFKDIEYFEGKYTVNFIGKGSTEAEQEIRPDAIEAVNQAFTAQFNRAGQPEDYLFNTLESYKNKPKTRISKSVLWDRIHKIGVAVKAEGIIKRDVQFSAHLFRRTFATLLYKQGMKLKALQKATRHASIETLAKHYIDDSEPTTPYFDDILKVV